MMMDEKKIQIYFEACIESSNRSRYFLLILSFVSIFSLAFFWNTRYPNWNQVERSTYQALYHYLRIFESEFQSLSGKLKKDREIEINDLNGKTKKTFKEELKLINLTSELESMNNDSYDISVWDTLHTTTINKMRSLINDSEADKAESVIKILNKQYRIVFKSKILISIKIDYYKEVCNNLLKNDINHHQSHFPLFPIEVNSNDLSVFCGFTLTIILVILCITFQRELKNLVFFFRQIKKLDITERITYYQTLSMRQVFTSPPELNESYSEVHLVWVVPKILILLPILVHGIIFSEFILDSDNNRLHNEKVYTLIIILSSIFIGSIFFFSLIAVYLNRRVDNAWKYHAQEIKDLENQNNLFNAHGFKFATASNATELKGSQDKTENPQEQTP